MNKRLKWSLYIGFVAIGLTASIIGPMLSVIRTAFAISYAQSGLLLSSQFLGIFLTVLVGGRPADKYGKKPLMIFGGFLLCFGMLGSMFAGSLTVLLIWTVCGGIGMGIYELCINAMCAELSVSNRGDAMSILNAFYGLGAILGPVLAFICLKFFNSWRLVFGISAVLPGIITFMLKPITIENHATQPSQRQSVPFKNSLLWISGFFIFIYVGIEASMQGWLPTFWGKIAPRSIISASLTGSIFWLALTLGRLKSGRLADQTGLSKFIRIVCLSIMLLSFVWMFIPFGIPTIIAAILIGLFLAGIFPVLVASTTSYFPGASGTVTSFIIVFASLGGLVIPSAIGKLADLAGIQKFPIVIAGLAVLLFAFAVCREKIVRKKTPELTSFDK